MTRQSNPASVPMSTLVDRPGRGPCRLGQEVVVEAEAQLPLRARVLRRTELARDIALFELGAPVGSRLPTWEPGAHVEVAIESEGEALLRHYSLVDEAASPTWKIAVQLEHAGRGGSRAIHEQLHEGQTIEVRRVANHFPLVDAPAYVFVAAGIGVTPIVSLAAAALRAGRPVRLVQLARSEDRAVDLGLWPALHGADVERIVSAEPVALPELLGPVPVGAAVMACGPAGLLDALAELAVGQPWTFHCERFAPSAAASSNGADRPFDVTLAQSRKVLHVPAGRSLLEVLLENDVPVEFSCREGTCATCEVGVLDGEVDHRDSVLDEEERAENSCMMPCVSRARGDRVVLDL